MMKQNICNFGHHFIHPSESKSLFDQIFYRNEQLSGAGLIFLINSVPFSIAEAFMQHIQTCHASCTTYYGDPREKTYHVFRPSHMSELPLNL